MKPGSLPSCAFACAVLPSIPVAVRPGPSGAIIVRVAVISTANDSDSESAQSFVAAQVACVGTGWKAATEATFSTRPTPRSAPLDPARPRAARSWRAWP